MSTSHHTTAPARSDNSSYQRLPVALADLPETLSHIAGWIGMDDATLHRKAAEAAQHHDGAALVGLTHAYLSLHGRSGARLSAHTLRAYRAGVEALLAAWAGENLLHPDRHAGRRWLRALEGAGAAPSTVSVRLAAARTLYKALAWAGATDANPFADARAAPETTAPWDKRQPYSEADIALLLHHADPLERAIVLLGAHAGLRVSEMCQLAWTAIANDSLTVMHGKGGKRRVVSMSRSLREALAYLQKALENMPNPIPGRESIPVGGRNGACPEDGYIITAQSTRLVLGGLNSDAVRYRIARLCVQCGVQWRGIHALRHAAGTRLYRATEDLNIVAAHLGHANLETSRIYAKFSDQRLRNTLADW